MTWAALIALAGLTLLGGVYLARRIDSIAEDVATAIDMADCAGELTIAVGVYAVRDEPIEFEIIEADLFGLTET